MAWGAKPSRIEWVTLTPGVEVVPPGPAGFPLGEVRGFGVPSGVQVKVGANTGNSMLGAKSFRRRADEETGLSKRATESKVNPTLPLPTPPLRSEPFHPPKPRPRPCHTYFPFTPHSSPPTRPSLLRLKVQLDHLNFHKTSKIKNQTQLPHLTIL